MMDQKTVRKLEQELEGAIAEIIVRMGLTKLPLLPSHQTMHLMAKAAVTVYESAVENERGSAAQTTPISILPIGPSESLRSTTSGRSANSMARA